MDQDSRKAIRALLSGGLYDIEDDALEQLLEQAASIQRSRGKAPSLDEMKYLEEYCALCEQATQYYIDYGWVGDQYDDQLLILNEKYPNVKHKTEIMSGTLNQDPGWESSSMEC